MTDMVGMSGVELTIFVDKHSLCLRLRCSLPYRVAAMQPPRDLPEQRLPKLFGPPTKSVQQWFKEGERIVGEELYRRLYAKYSVTAV